MKKNDRVVHLALILSLAVMVLLSYILHFFVEHNHLLSIYAGFFTSLIFFLFAYFTIRWTINKPIHIFLKAIVGGLVFRFIALILVTLWIHLSQTLNVIYFIPAFFLFYVFFQFAEINAVTKILNEK